MARAVAWLAMFSILLAGCSESPDAPLEQAPQEPVSPGAGNNQTEGPQDQPQNVTLPPLPFEFTGKGCREFMAIIQVPVQNVREFVPDNITILGQETGETMFFAGLKACDEYSVNGALPQPGMVSDVGVLIEAPDGSDGNHYYQLWMASDHEDFVGAHEALGVWGGLAQTNYTETELAPQALEANAQIRWGEGSYTIDGTSGGSPSAPAAQFTGWPGGSLGLFRVEKSFTYSHYAAGEGSVVGSSGSPMQSLLGTVYKDGAALHNHYDMVGSAQLV